jgi:uncharacterized protein
MHAGLAFESMRTTIERSNLPAVYERLNLILFPDDAELWNLMLAIFDYDPRPAMERISVPTLALFGGDDAIVPVDHSVAVYREAVRPDLLTVRVFPGADHRVQTHDPLRLADDYLETLSSFIAAAVT